MKRRMGGSRVKSNPKSHAELGHEVRQYLRTGMTVASVADRMGLSPAMVSRLSSILPPSDAGRCAASRDDLLDQYFESVPGSERASQLLALVNQSRVSFDAGVDDEGDDDL